MKVSVEFDINRNTMNALKNIPNVIMYKVARQTLDLSYPIIPKDTHKMARTSNAMGVRGSSGNYYIGSYTNYASNVWNMSENTNWTTPNTNNKWFTRALKQHGKTILDNAINQAWKEYM